MVGLQIVRLHRGIDCISYVFGFDLGDWQAARVQVRSPRHMEQYPWMNAQHPLHGETVLELEAHDNNDVLRMAAERAFRQLNLAQCLFLYTDLEIELYPKPTRLFDVVCALCCEVLGLLSGGLREDMGVAREGAAVQVRGRMQHCSPFRDCGRRRRGERRRSSE